MMIKTAGHPLKGSNNLALKVTHRVGFNAVVLLQASNSPSPIERDWYTLDTLRAEIEPDKPWFCHWGGCESIFTVMVVVRPVTKDDWPSVTSATYEFLTDTIKPKDGLHTTFEVVTLNTRS